jgi:phosphatidylglycerol:prolipoprotein diacylglycerol transferase
MHPILFYITKKFYIGTYGVMIAIGVLAGVLLAVRRGGKEHFKQDVILDLAFFCILGGIIGARLLYIIVYFRAFLEAPLQYLFARQGFVFLGGIAGAVAVGTIFIRRHRLPFWQIADVLAPSIPLAHTFGRLGCFSAGCCYGKPVPSWLQFLGIRFPAVFDQSGMYVGSGALLDHLNAGLLPPGATHSLPVYPTQLFESGANLLIFVTLLLVARRKRFDGQLLLLYLLLYSGVRFLVEFLRGDLERGIWFNTLSTSQILSIAVIGLAIYFWTRRHKAGSQNEKRINR